MTDAPKYYDIRSELWQSAFAAALPYEQYLASSPHDKAENWRKSASRVPGLSAQQIQRLEGYNRELKVLVSSGIWCGDCSRPGPMLDQIARVAGADMRWIDRDANEALRDELRIVGAMRVPMVVFLTEEYQEIGRFGDRMLAVYRRKMKSEVGAACALPQAMTPTDDLAAEQEQWVEIFERMLIMARLSPPLRQKHGD